MHDGQRSNDSFQELISNFSLPESKYAPYVFWFYDQDLTTLGAKPREMAHELAKKGFNPGYAHARPNYAHVYGKVVSEHVRPIPAEQWLTDQWFDLLEAQAQEAETDGSHACFADEFAWPSFQAAGRIIRDDPSLKARSLAFEYRDLEAGETAELGDCFFAVSARRESTERTSFITFDAPDSWKLNRASFDQSSPFDDNTQPLNMAAAFSESPDASCAYNVNIPSDGMYVLSACWGNTGDNTSDAEYSAGGQTFRVDQRTGTFRWNVLGEIELQRGMNIVSVKNRGKGKLSVDAVKITGKDGFELIVDDLQTTDREIAYIEPESLAVIDGDSYTAAYPARVYIFNIREQRGYDGGRVDYLQHRLSQVFFEKAWKPALERLGKYMGAGRPVNGIFSDHEGDYGYKLAWSDDLAKLFKEKYGEDIRRILPMLIDRDTRGTDVINRFRWFDTVSDIYASHFKRMSEEAAKHGLYYTMHTWEESLQLQASCVGDIFKVVREVTLPGTDALCRVAYNPLNFKDHFSVAEFEGRRFMNEVMALNGLTLYTPEELKKQGNYLAAYGVGHVIDHAVKMTRQAAQSVVTPDFYNIDPCWQAMRQYTSFVSRFSYINSLGSADADVLLVNPLDSMYALAENDFFDMDFDMLAEHGGIPKTNAAFGGIAGEINRLYGQTIRVLTRKRIEHLSADKAYIREAEVRDGNLYLRGHRFSSVVVPRIAAIDIECVQKLASFAKAGGQLFWMQPLPSSTLQNGRNDESLRELLASMQGLPNVHFIASPDEIDAVPAVITDEKQLLCHRRLIDGRHFVFVCNMSGRDVDTELVLTGLRGGITLLDPATGAVSVPDASGDDERFGGVRLSISFAPYQSFYIVVDPNDAAVKAQPEQADNTVTRKLEFEHFTAYIDRGNTSKTVDHVIPAAEISAVRLTLRKGCFDDPTHPDVESVELLLGGKSVLKRNINESFTVVYDEVGEVVLRFEPARVDTVRVTSKRGMTSYRIETSSGGIFRTVSELDTYSQSELINLFDYPSGSFEAGLGDWKDWGILPEKFAGVVTYKTEFELGERDIAAANKAHGAVLEADVRGGSVVALINGTEVGRAMFLPLRFDASGVLKSGVNTLELRVSNTISSNVLGKAGGLKNASLTLRVCP
ncbi:MAG: hypothetical protein J5950_03040 [Clostridia bacterium]|nr:hypothetical protein [Clostridia bacterium]